MSAVFDDTGNKYLTATLASAPASNENIFIMAHVKREAGHAVGSTEIIVEAKSSSQSNLLRLMGSTGPLFQSSGDWGSGTPQNAAQTTNYSESTWYHVGAYMDKSDGGFFGISNYWDGGVKRTASHSDPGTATQALSVIGIGSGFSFNAYSNWPSLAAEVSIWTVLAEADADTLFTAGGTTAANGITPPTGAVLKAYWPLTTTSQLTATVGPTLTNNGSTTFSADHPSLSGGGGGSNPIGFSRPNMSGGMMDMTGGMSAKGLYTPKRTFYFPKKNLIVPAYMRRRTNPTQLGA